MKEYMEYLEEFWFYSPYIIYAYVFLTLLPKSLYRIKKFADEDYEANMHKYHRCYGPDLCCHRLATADGAAIPNKVKARKPVTRIYPKRNYSANIDSGYPSTSSHSSENSKRPVQTYTHVNQIARMFEIGGVASSNNNNSSTPMSKKINRVPPTIYPSELKTPMQKTEHLQYFTSKAGSERQQENSPNFVKLRTVPKVQLERRSSAEEFAQMLLSKDLLDLNDIELLASCEQTTTNSSRLTRRGTSATPSTASPAASCSPMSASPPASPRHLSPTKTTRSSLDDIFAAIAKSAEVTETELFMCSADAEANLLSPVTSIDDILSQRRLSRPLSAYSISDLLLNEENSKTLTTTTEPTQEVEEELLNNKT